MIRNENEYQEAVIRLKEERGRLNAHRKQLETDGLTPEQVRRVCNPMESFHLQLAEEVDSYERLKRGEFDDFHNLLSIGHLLIGLRIAQGDSRRALAERLGVNESQVSRDERNEYHGIALDRAERILNALHAELRTTVKNTWGASGSRGVAVCRT